MVSCATPLPPFELSELIVDHQAVTRIAYASPPRVGTHTHNPPSYLLLFLFSSCPPLHPTPESFFIYDFLSPSTVLAPARPSLRPLYKPTKNAPANQMAVPPTRNATHRLHAPHATYTIYSKNFNAYLDQQRTSPPPSCPPPITNNTTLGRKCNILNLIHDFTTNHISY